MAFTEKFLGQVRPDDSTSVVLYTAPVGVRTIIKHIQIANAMLDSGRVKINLDNTGQGLSGTLQINTAMQANSSKSLPVFWVIDGGGSLMVQVINSVGGTTVTAYGAEIDAS